MITEKTIIEAQQICLEAAKEVFNFLEIAFTNMEKDECFTEEPTLSLEPYNQGYQIKIQAFTDWRKFDTLPSYFSNIHIQPNTFFAEYMKEGKGARLEFSQFFKGVTGYQHTQVDVKTMKQFQYCVNLWVDTIKREIENV